MKRSILVFAVLLIFVAVARAQNEQAPIVEKEFVYKNWTYPDLRSGTTTDLRKFASNKKLVLVVYFAAWCPNWKHEAPFVQSLYEKYKSSGLDVIGVSEYDTIEATKTNLDSFKITFPVVSESEARDAKKMTLHYQYRTAAGDTRNWGSPWNVFLLPASLERKGDVLTRKTFVVNGELIEPEVEKFVRERLGLPAENKTEVSQEKDPTKPCSDDKPNASLKKP